VTVIQLSLSGANHLERLQLLQNFADSLSSSDWNAFVSRGSFSVMRCKHYMIAILCLTTATTRSLQPLSLFQPRQPADLAKLDNRSVRLTRTLEPSLRAAPDCYSIPLQRSTNQLSSAVGHGKPRCSMRRVPAATKASRFSTCWLAANRFSAGPDPIWPASVSARYPLELRPRCCVSARYSRGRCVRAFLLAARLAGVRDSTMTIGGSRASQSTVL